MEEPVAADTHNGESDPGYSRSVTDTYPQQPAKRPNYTLRRIAVGVPLLAVLAAGGYVAAAAFTPLPESELVVTNDLSQTVDADPAPAQALVDARGLPTAISWDRNATWVNDDTARPIASISKLVTALVALEQQPLEPGEDGPTYVWSERDIEQQNLYLEDNGIIYPTPIGTEMTTRQLLTMSLVMSANEFAYAYAMSVFGTDEAFVAAVNAWKAEHGLDSLIIGEPTGMDPANVASPTDIMQIGWLAADHPTITEITAIESTTMPWSDEPVENTNWLLESLPGVYGLKTGFTEEIGYNLVAAQRTESEGRALTQMAVTLARDSEWSREEETRDVLVDMVALPARYTVVESGVEIGTITGVDGTVGTFTTDGEAAVTLLPGESATSALEWSDRSGSAAGQVGTVSVTGPEGTVDVPVVLDAALEEPDLWWRITHPAELYGWGE